VLGSGSIDPRFLHHIPIQQFLYYFLLRRSVTRFESRQQMGTFQQAHTALSWVSVLMRLIFCPLLSPVTSWTLIFLTLIENTDRQKSFIGIKWHTIKKSNIFLVVDRLCGLVVRVPGYRCRGPGFDSRALQKKSSGSETGSTQPREYNWGATW
jgi:hypothetical protein